MLSQVPHLSWFRVLLLWSVRCCPRLTLTRIRLLNDQMLLGAFEQHLYVTNLEGGINCKCPHIG